MLEIKDEHREDTKKEVWQYFYSCPTCTETEGEEAYFLTWGQPFCQGCGEKLTWVAKYID